MFDNIFIALPGRIISDIGTWGNLLFGVIPRTKTQEAYGR
jgi:hypothetical protein